MRIDKWLWAARFFKTRQLAVKAIKTGKISINDQIISKPATSVKVGDTLSLKRSPFRTSITIEELSEQRGPAPVAQALYKETSASIVAREQLKRQLAAQPKLAIDRRKPDKRGIRDHRALKRGE